MKTIILATASLVGPLSLMAPAKSQVETLKDRCSEQERQIKELEKEIDNLHSLLNRDAHHSGQVAKRSTTTSSRTSASLPVYKVQKGDSLSKIARKNGTTLAKLISANKGIDPNKLNIGQSINLPGSHSAPVAKAKSPVSKAPIAKSNSVNSVRNYTVQKGETIYGIARKTGSSVDAILAANDKLDPRKIYAGKRISIPANGYVPSKAPVAKKASKPAPVAKKAPAKQSAPIAKKAPEKKAAPVAKAPAKREEVQKVNHTPAQPQVRTVTVAKQMTYGDFADMHSASIARINELNGLSLSKSTVLAQGSELYIPGSQN